MHHKVNPHTIIITIHTFPPHSPLSASLGVVECLHVKYSLAPGFVLIYELNLESFPSRHYIR